MTAKWNIMQFQIPVFFSGWVTLETGNVGWGAIHINEKCADQNKPITNAVIHEVLSSWTSVFLIVVSGIESGTLRYDCTAFKINPITASGWKMAVVVLAPHPVFRTYFTITTADLIKKTSDPILVPLLLASLIKWLERTGNYKVIYIPIPVPSIALNNAPAAIASESFDSYLQGLNNDAEEQAEEIAENAIAQLLSGTWVETVILWINGVILSFCTENSALYYIVWIAVVTIILALLVVIVWAAIVYIPQILACLPSVIPWFLNLFSTSSPPPVPGFSLLSLNSVETYATLDDTTSHLYDEDADGIPNYVERNYFELYIEDTPEEQIYLNQENTWLDPKMDTDEDDLYALTETIYNSNPFEIDTDGDGLDDNFEIEVGEPAEDFTFEAMLTDNDGDGNLDTQVITIQGDITVHSNPSLYDSDFDGLGDAQEWIIGTNSLNRDSDEDDLLDGYEVYAEMFGWDGTIYADLSPIQDNSNWAGSDLDGDGYNNSVESWLFTDPNSIDTDGDGLNDNEEGLYSTDPTDADTDRDQLSDGDEIFHNTDPLDFDTDRDLMPDGYEVAYDLNPLVDDTLNDLDGDSLSNWDEFYTYHTHPNDVDTDNDGLDDYEEVTIHNTDPNNQDSDGDNLNDFVEVETYETNPNSSDSDNDLLGDYFEIMTHHTDPTNPDTDGDGLNDGWEIYFEGTNPLDADSDNDGLNDGEEIDSYNTDPTIADTDGDGMRDGWEVEHGFNPLSHDSGGDADNDGATNLIEYLYDTDPYDVDTDNDEMKDGWEISKNTNPLVNDASSDPDNDGLTNLEEYVLNSHPLNSDTDGDYMPDGWEISYGLNPTNANDGIADADGDGLRNFEEYLIGTVPTDSDTDNDGLDDLWEINWGRILLLLITLLILTVMG